MRRALLFLLTLAVVTTIAAACETASFEIEIPTPKPVETRTLPTPPTPVPVITTPATPVPTPHAILGGQGYEPALCQPLLATVATNMVLAANDVTLVPGDEVLIHQTQDDASDGDSSGTFELQLVGLVTSLSGGDVNLLGFPDSLGYAYETAGRRKAQLCRVPYWSTLTLGAGAQLRAAPWGTDLEGKGAGGILPFRADSVTLDAGAAIHADGRGFRGGISQESNGPPTMTLATAMAGISGGKGEGQDAEKYGTYARGAALRGGGGGNRTFGAGGGGAGAGSGGAGGTPTLGGLGGVGTASLTGRFGGGGGGAHGSAGFDAGNGGPGGGFVWAAIGTIDAPAGSSSVRFSADGLGGVPCTVNMGSNAGGGGGGGGGAIFLDAPVCNGSGGAFRVTVSGGSGGNCDGEPGSNGGGGGGGGEILTVVCQTSVGLAQIRSAGGGDGNDGGDTVMSSADDGLNGASGKTGP